MSPKYDLDKIKFATDEPTFERAVGLYENGKVIQFEEDFVGYTAVVLGTQLYRVFVSNRYYDRGSCECYLGQNNRLCKHVVAVAIQAVAGGKSLSEEEKQLVGAPVCSGRRGEFNKDELSVAKKAITSAMHYIKPYNGSSRLWFSYQDSLSEGCSRLSAIVSDLPVSKQTAGLLINMLLRLDKKLCTGGVDDSDGAVGGFIQEVVDVLLDYYKLDPACGEAFEMLCGKSICFEWEEPLVRIVDGEM